ncbi:ABC transporter permease [Kitasatospora sp. NPDC006697]|uniref:ABC transporter permease n=1 Tax=Kitasatospora sp. NPDC006697 TaxID=3364020 RepID=UPI0036B102C8
MSTRPTAGAAEPEPAPRLRDLLAAEWIKIRSLRSTYWVLALSAVAAIAINLNAVHSDLRYLDHPPRLAAGLTIPRYDPLWHGLNSIAADVITLAAAVFGAITVFGEYTTGLIRATFAAVPDRRAVVAAKIITVTGITLPLGVLVAAVSFFGSNAMLASRHVGLSIGDDGCLRAVAGYALAVPVCALVGMAIGAVLRHATASVSTVVGLLFLAPMLFGGDRYRLLREIGNCLPLTAEARLALNPHTSASLGLYPPTVTGAWLTLAGWALAGAAVTVVAVRRRDA